MESMAYPDNTIFVFGHFVATCCAAAAIFGPLSPPIMLPTEASTRQSPRNILNPDDYTYPRN